MFLASQKVIQTAMVMSILALQMFLLIILILTVVFPKSDLTISLLKYLDPVSDQLPPPSSTNNTSSLLTQLLLDTDDQEFNCIADNVSVTPLRNGTVAYVKATSSSHSDVRPLKVSRLSFVTTERHHWSCTFARINEYEVLTTPGGDMGEYLTALAAYISLSENTTDFSVERIRVLWYSYLEDACVQKKKLFYMHTNATAVQQLGDALGITTTWSIVDPPSAYRTQLLELVVEPQYIGCHHLRMMVEHPTQYGVPRGLFNTLMRLYYSTLWGLEPGSEEYRYNLRLEVTPTTSPYNRVAVVNIYHTGCSGMTPALVYDVPNVFTLRPQEIFYLRNSMAAHFHFIEENSDTAGENHTAMKKSKILGNMNVLFDKQASILFKHPLIETADTDVYELAIAAHWSTTNKKRNKNKNKNKK
eukprot:PhF_6_TR10992/c2_g1_i1/m.17788